MSSIVLSRQKCRQEADKRILQAGGVSILASREILLKEADVWARMALDEGRPAVS